MKSNPKNRPRRTAVRGIIVDPVSLAPCLDRSAAASGALPRPYRPAFPGATPVAGALPPAECLEVVERPRRRGSSGRSGPANLSRSKGADRRAHETRQRGSGTLARHGRATMPSWKNNRAGPAAGSWAGQPPWPESRSRASRAGEMSGLKHAFMGSPAIGNFNGFWRIPPHRRSLCNGKNAQIAAAPARQRPVSLLRGQ